MAAASSSGAPYGIRDLLSDQFHVFLALKPFLSGIRRADKVAEISRVLRPGGVFVATTFIWDGPFSLIPFQGNIAQRTKQMSGNQLFTSESELEDICQACGLVGFTKVRNGRFVMISATKPI